MIISDKSLELGVHDRPYMDKAEVGVEITLNMETGELQNVRVVGSSLDEAVETMRQKILESP